MYGSIQKEGIASLPTSMTSKAAAQPKEDVSVKDVSIVKKQGSDTDGDSTLKTVLKVTLVVFSSVILISAFITSAPPPSSGQMAALPSPPSTLSKRGSATKVGRDDLAMFMEASASPYHPQHNPDGYLVMLVAENKLMWQELAAKLQQVQMAQQPPLPQWMFDYGDMSGELTFKTSVARNVLPLWLNVSYPIEPEYMRFQAGVGSILDQLSYVLGDAGDGVMVTGPNYPAFGADFGTYGTLQLYIAQTKAANGYQPTLEELNDAYDKAVAEGHTPKILILCQPNNPTGVIYSKESMRLMITWALSKDMHIVSDEIYALSVFPGEQTTSAAEIMSELYQEQHQSLNVEGEHEDEGSSVKFLGDHVHVVGGMSKDFGMSGFRVGYVFSHNEQLLHAFDAIGYYQSVSQYTQHALTGIFADKEWLEWYVEENQRRLHQNYQALEQALAKIHVSLSPTTKGALFAWCDFSSHLKEGQTERELWMELFEKAKVAFTTGESCHGDKPGMFRIVYSWPEGGTKAMDELGDRLVKWAAER